MNLATWATGSDVAHLPKVVLGVARQHALWREVLEPQLARLLVLLRAPRLVISDL